jgi:hypothetical protein
MEIRRPGEEELARTRRRGIMEIKEKR